MTATAAAIEFGLGPIDQVSFAVRDLEASLPAYEALFGTFRVVTSTLEQFTYRGRTAGPTTVKLGFAMSGDLEIELVEVVSGGFPQVEHLQKHGEGLQHVRYKVDDVDAVRARMEAAGYAAVIVGDSERARFCYLESPDKLGHTMIELIRYSA